MKKKHFLIMMFVCFTTSITSCSNNKNNKEENGIDSVAIAQAKADSIAKSNNLAVGMSVKEALQKPGVKKDYADAFDGQHEGDALVLIQNGKKFLTNVSYHMKNGFAECDHLNFTLLPDSYEGDITLVRAKDCAASAKIVKEIK